MKKIKFTRVNGTRMIPRYCDHQNEIDCMSSTRSIVVTRFLEATCFAFETCIRNDRNIIRFLCTEMYTAISIVKSNQQVQWKDVLPILAVYFYN